MTATIALQESIRLAERKHAATRLYWCALLIDKHSKMFARFKALSMNDGAMWHLAKIVDHELKLKEYKSRL